MTEPFLTYRLPFWAEALAHFCQHLSAAKRLAFLLRKPVLALGREVVDIEVLGTRFRLYPGDNLSDKRLLCTPYMLDGRERALLADDMPEGGWLVDVGANIGGYALQLVRTRPDIQVLCLEPDPDMSDRLTANIAFNHFEQRVRVERAAVTEKPAEVQLFRNKGNRGQNSLMPDMGTERDEAISVSGKPLLALFDGYGIQRPAALKLDIEGFEHVVLRGFFREAPKDRWPRLIQLEQYRREPFNDAVELVLSKGYQLRLRTRMNVILELTGES